MGRRRRKQTGIDAWLEIGARLPWWATLLSALLVHLILRQIASLSAGGSLDGSSDIGLYAARQIILFIATIGQYVVPLILIAGMVQSLLSDRSSVGRRDSGTGTIASACKPATQKTGKAKTETDIYPVYKEVNGLNLPAVDTRSWNLELLRAIDWKLFEEVCAEYFRICGFDAETQTHGPDGGIDIWLYPKGDRTRLENIVQCKQYSRAYVGPKLVRELLGVLTDQGVSRGMFVTASDFTADAIKFARKNGIFPINGEELIRKIRDRSTEEQQRLLDVATKGDFLVPTCASCGTKMVKRRGRNNQSFWGCRNYPRCRSKLQMAGKVKA